jgi:hypothetical protein
MYSLKGVHDGTACVASVLPYASATLYRPVQPIYDTVMIHDSALYKHM